MLSQVANFAGENDPCGLYADRLANVEMFSIPNGELYKEMLFLGVVPSGELQGNVVFRCCSMWRILLARMTPAACTRTGWPMCKCFLSQRANFKRKCCHQVLSQVANFVGEHDPCSLYADRLANVKMFSIPKGELYKKMLYSGVVPSGEFCWRE